MMTEEQILELAKNCDFDFSIKWRLKGEKSSNQMYWECWEEQLLKFAQAIHRQTRRDTLHEIIARLSSAPNAEVNQYAIILTEKQLIPND